MTDRDSTTSEDHQEWDTCVSGVQGQLEELGKHVLANAVKARQALAGVATYLSLLAAPERNHGETTTSLEGAKRTIAILKAELGRDPGQARSGWAQLVASINQSLSQLEGLVS